LPPSDFNAEGVLFDVPLKAQFGKPIVVMYPEDEAKGGILLPETVRSKYQPDWAVVAKVHPDDTYLWGLEVGHIVPVKPYTGAWFGPEEFDWIPKGRLIKILGTAEHWMENILCVLDVNETTVTVKAA